MNNGLAAPEKLKDYAGFRLCFFELRPDKAPETAKVFCCSAFSANSAVKKNWELKRSI